LHVDDRVQHRRDGCERGSQAITIDCQNFVCWRW
jgi:hypothetical protein